MKKIDRGLIKDLFPKVKKLILPKDLDEVEFEQLNYFSWFDSMNHYLYTIYEFNGELTGIQWKISTLTPKALALIMCDICNKERKRSEVYSIYSSTKTLPKHLTYRSRGFFICSDLIICNQSMINNDGISKVYSLINSKD